jgi:hypothetical protein
MARCTVKGISGGEDRLIALSGISLAIISFLLFELMVHWKQVKMMEGVITSALEITLSSPFYRFNI